jgi:hypothetical protein
MAGLQLTLSDEEREYLVAFLENALKESEVEEHRTRTLLYREHVLQQEKLIEGLLNKLRQPAG